MTPKWFTRQKLEDKCQVYKKDNDKVKGENDKNVVENLMKCVEKNEKLSF